MSVPTTEISIQAVEIMIHIIIDCMNKPFGSNVTAVNTGGEYFGIYDWHMRRWKPNVGPIQRMWTVRSDISMGLGKESEKQKGSETNKGTYN